MEKSVREWVHTHWNALHDYLFVKHPPTCRHAPASYVRLADNDFIPNADTPWDDEDDDNRRGSPKSRQSYERRWSRSSSFRDRDDRGDTPNKKYHRCTKRNERSQPFEEETVRKTKRSSPIPIVSRPPDRQGAAVVGHPPDTPSPVSRLFERDVAAFDLPHTFVPSKAISSNPGASQALVLVP